MKLDDIEKLFAVTPRSEAIASLIGDKRARRVNIVECGRLIGCNDDVAASAAQASGGCCRRQR